MKRLIIICTLTSLFIMPILAFKTTFTSYLYPSSNVLSESQYNENPTSTLRMVTFINHATSIPELSNALDEANKIFSHALQEKNIDLVDLQVEVCVASIADPDAVCEVEIIYSDTIEDNTRYHGISHFANFRYPVLIPMALSNQSRGQNYGLGMRIKFRDTPDYYYCGNGAVPEGKFDATTIILRALAMGCGIQSTFNASTLEVGINDGTKTYVSAFDTQIYNEDSIPLVSVLDGQNSIYTFLAGKNIYAIGNSYFDDTILVQLYNEWQYFPGEQIHSLTLNSIDPYQYREGLGYGGEDVLTADIQRGVAIRTLTPYTLLMLKRLGWMRTVTVGQPGVFDDVIQGKISCSSTTLQPNTIYVINIDKPDVSLQNVHCVLYSNDSSYQIGTGYDVIPAIRYSSIPANIQWNRDVHTKHIIGQVKATAYKYDNGVLMTREKTFDVQIPYRPNKPIVQKTESFNSPDLNLSIHAFANGSNTYTVAYTGLTNADVHTFTISADVIDTILSIPATQYYDVAIYGTNAMGNSDTCSFTIGSSIQPEINLMVSVEGSTLRYYLNSDNATYLPNVQIGASTITNHTGSRTIHLQASPGEVIDISSLSFGVYLFSVSINGTTYSKIFFKRRN